MRRAFDEPAVCGHLTLEVRRNADGLTLASRGLERLQRQGHLILPQ